MLKKLFLRSKFSFFLILSGLVLFFPVNDSLRSQAWDPTEMDLGSYQEQSWSSLFEQAWNLSDVQTWNQMVQDQYFSLKGDWETQADLQFSEILSQVLQSDEILDNSAYVDYVSKYLELERAEAEKSWESDAELRIQEERNYFLDSLQGRQVDELGYALSSSSRSDLDASIQDWNRKFQDAAEVGLYEFQNALTSLETKFQEMKNSITSTDSELQNNLNQIAQYENQVRQSIQSGTQDMKLYLLQQNLLQKRDANGNSLLGDLDGKTEEELLSIYSSIDSNGLNEAGKKLKTLIDNLDEALDPDHPSSLSEIAGLMQSYFSEEQENASEIASEYREDEYSSWSYGNPNVSVHELTFTTSNSFTSNPDSPGGVWKNELATSIRKYIETNGSNTTELLDLLNGYLGNPDLTVSEIGAIDLKASSSRDYLQSPEITNWNSDWNQPVTRVGGSYVEDGNSFWTLTNHYWLCWDGLCLPGQSNFAEETVYLDASLTIHDAAAQANAEQYENFRNELNAKLSSWQNVLVPAIQNWETQVSNYQARYSEWQTTKISLENQLTEERSTQIAELYKNRDDWANELTDLYMDSKSFSTSSSNLPTFSSQVSESSGLSSFSKTLESFQDLKTPDTNNLSTFYNGIGQAVNGAYNLSMVEANRILAQETQKNTIDSLVANLKNQKEMKESISEEAYAAFSGKKLDGSNAAGIEGANSCNSANAQSNESYCNSLYNNTKNFDNKYEDVYVDDEGNIHVKQSIKTSSASYNGSGDITDYKSYKLAETVQDFVVGNVGTVKLGDISASGDLFSSNWIQSENSSKVSSALLSSQKNNSSEYLNSEFLDSINKNAANVDAFASLQNQRAQQNAITKASAASTVVSIAQTIFAGGSGMDWAKQQVKDMTKSAVATGISQATGIPADVITAFIDYKADQKAKQKAQHDMDVRMAIINPFGYVLNYVPGVKDLMRPVNQILAKGVSEIIQGTTNLLTESDIGIGLRKTGAVSQSSLNHLHDIGTEAAEFVRGKDLQADLSKGDVQAKWKSDLKTVAYNQIAEQLAPPGMDPQVFSQIWQEYDKRQAAKAAKKEQEQQMISTAIQVAASVALQFVPGPGTAAGASMLAQVGSYFSSARGMIVTANAVAQGIIASRNGNMNAVAAGVVNGLLLGVTGPMGLAGSVSYTPPTKKNTLGAMLDEGFNGPSASGWGGGISIGGSYLNGGVSFMPGTGVNLNLGGTIGDTGGFYNLSYNTKSGNTNLTLGAGQEYGSNLGVNLSTDNDQKPSIFLGFGCDLNENNCGGGGANKLGLGGSLTLDADGNVTLGADILGNQGLGVTYNADTNSWGQVTGNTNFGNDYTVMTAQTLADKAKTESQMKVAGTYGDVLKDPNLIANSESLKSIADSYGVKPENLPEVIQNLSDTVRNPDADPALRQSALVSLNEMMGAVHNEAYVKGNQNLKDAIQNSPAVADVAVQGKDKNGTAEAGFFNQVGEQAKIYLNQLAGNAFGDFAYINDKGEVVFRSCFVAGTLVHTKDGLRPIETVKVGDVVLTKSDMTGEIRYKRVVQTFVRSTDAIFKIIFVDSSLLETTWSHPFRKLKVENREESFGIENSEWTQVKDLQSGDIILTASGEALAIESIEVEDRKETVYNFEVEDFHSYFVGENGVWVHNVDGYGPDMTIAGCVAGGPWGCAGGLTLDVIEAAVVFRIGQAAFDSYEEAVAACASTDCVNKVKEEFDKYKVKYTNDAKEFSLGASYGKGGAEVSAGFTIDKSKSGWDAIKLNFEAGGESGKLGTSITNQGVDEIKGTVGNSEVSIDRNGQLKYKYGTTGQADVTYDIGAGEISKVGVSVKSEQKAPNRDSISIGTKTDVNIGSNTMFGGFLQNQYDLAKTAVQNWWKKQTQATLPTPICGVTKSCSPVNSCDGMQMSCGKK
ncbi:TIGR04388 family protein [Leptospira neocaledonica]|uniref:Hint domain-containing protein n=1 Tax=Leptospira neocaledonica TaxID=2023192 RepID=A0A2N0A2N3_9LEPT|nr:TIGR04388 family protein [Leptospira neocaledonica]PJZ78545.1 hypothetical protein CH365_04370 [Leptospira neocaledonica]